MSQQGLRGLSDAVVSVIGAGAMGSGIGEVAARARHPVRLIDSNPDVLARSRSGIEQSLDGLVGKGRLSSEDRDATMGRIEWCSDLIAAHDAGLVIEAIVERMDVKQDLLRSLEAVVSSSAIIGTNTSSLSVGEMSSVLVAPGRFIGLHFFNPVPAMKLVEIVPGPATADGLAVVVSSLMEAWGKSPVVVQDVPGFIVNRVARPFYGEAFEAWGDGVDPTAIDALLVGAGGFRMGPLALADMIGHDVNFAAASSVHEGYRGLTRFRPQPAQRALVEAGHLGRKSGKGVFDYPAPPEHTPSSSAPIAGRPPVSAPSTLGDLSSLVVRLSHGDAANLDENLPPDVFAAAGLIVALSDGRRLVDREGVHVLLDHARDFATATVIGFTAVDDQAAAAFSSLLERAGIRPVRLPDRPGLVVMRTLVQLAASVIDALEDEIASAKDIGLAMRLGANHPESPLDWAGRVGTEPLRTLQQRLSDATGDAMYAPDRARPSKEMTS